jgi:hypothetical protein
MKIKKKELLKLIKENSLELYNDNSHSTQYSSEEKEKKHLFTKISGIDVIWEKKGISNDYDTNGEVNVDWGIDFHFMEDGFSFQPFVTSVSGILTKKHYDSDYNQQDEQLKFVSKGYNINLNINLKENDNISSLKIKGVYINMDKKYINIDF